MPSLLACGQDPRKARQTKLCCARLPDTSRFRCPACALFRVEPPGEKLSRFSTMHYNTCSNALDCALILPKRKAAFASMDMEATYDSDSLAKTKYRVPQKLFRVCGYLFRYTPAKFIQVHTSFLLKHCADR